MPGVTDADDPLDALLALVLVVLLLGVELGEGLDEQVQARGVLGPPDSQGRGAIVGLQAALQA